MELREIAGLPAHPLFVHLPVVIVPLAGVIAIIFAFKPGWLDRFGWGLVGVSGLGALGAVLAASSGEALEGTMRDDGERISSALQEHAELGEVARNVSVLFFLVVLGIVALRYLVEKRRNTAHSVLKFAASRAGGLVMAGVLVVSAGAATALIANAGHDGAKQVWNEAYDED